MSRARRRPVTGERSRAREALGAAKARAINSVLTVLPPRLSVQIQYLRAHLRDAAETLGRHFSFATIDFYDLPEGPKFGEITFTPSSGHKRFTPDEHDMRLGALLDLDAASIPPR